MLELGQRFQAEDDDGEQNDEDRYNGDDPSRLRRLGILEQEPHVALELVRGQRFLLLLDEALVLPELVDGQFAQLVELDLFAEDVEGHVDRPAQPATALVVIEDGVERGPVSVEEVLIAERVEVAYSPGRVAQQRVRELVQRPKLGFEPKAAHLKQQHILHQPSIFN